MRIKILLTTLIMAAVVPAFFATTPSWSRIIDGPGGPVIVIDPGEGQVPPLRSAWSVICKQTYPAKPIESGSIARRWLKSPGATGMWLQPASGHPIEISMLVLRVTTPSGEERELTIEVARPNFVPVWAFGPIPVWTDRQALEEFPDDMMGKITKIEADGTAYDPKDVKRITIAHNQLEDGECE